MKNRGPRGFAYSACLLFFSLTTLLLQAQTVPSITGINPATAAAGASVIITGNNISSTISDNVVWFGGVKGTVTAAATTSLTVTVPPAAGTLVRVYNQGFMGESPVQFNLSFTGTESLSSSSFNSFTPSHSFVIQNGSYNGLANNSLGNLKFADLDADGKPDLITGRVGVYLQHNISTPGTISAG
ncbi:MAG TPA: IPT/TIG domain-containing protein, partial [Chitinophagaceae bacterium]|nr:IPT/TIG domain-containing protein [Chitinophagaceae bacterium]